jgi:hypothetical protein
MEVDKGWEANRVCPRSVGVFELIASCSLSLAVSLFGTCKRAVVAQRTGSRKGAEQQKQTKKSDSLIHHPSPSPSIHPSISLFRSFPSFISTSSYYNMSSPSEPASTTAVARLAAVQNQLTIQPCFHRHAIHNDQPTGPADLARERANASFPVEEMTKVLYGGEEKVKAMVNSDNRLIDTIV